jgi:hypothetical protein
MLIISWGYQRNFTAFSFGDEQDNFVLGKYVLSGDKIYSDLFAHHQPLAYVISAGIQQLSHPNSIYLLISRHRQFLILWALIWCILLTYKYGKSVPLFVLGYELGKIFIFGNLFLSESLAVYPLIYIYLFSLNHNRQPSKVEAAIIGFAWGFIFMVLSPLWPVLAAVFLLIIYRYRTNKYFLTYFLSMIALMVGFTLFFTSFKDYLINTFYINYKYYVPWSAAQGDSISFRSFLAPLTVFFIKPEGTFIWIVRLWSLLLITGTILLIRSKQSKTAVIGWILLALTGLRFVTPGKEMYSGFHALPWFALLVLTGIVFWLNPWHHHAHKISTRIFYLTFPLLSVIGTIILSWKLVYAVPDNGNNYYINYSPAFDIGEAVRVSKNPGDKLISVPGDDWLIYWQADIQHASPMINYFEWMLNTPELRDKVDSKFTSDSQPEYFYCRCEQTYLAAFLDRYTNLKKSGKPSHLYLSKTKAASLNDAQRQALSKYDFSL